jgi:hypothetical protein
MKKGTLITFFVTTHLVFMLLHIYKEALFVNASYAYQKYTNELKTIKDEEHTLQATLSATQSQLHIAQYAQENWGFKPLSLKQLERLS